MKILEKYDKYFKEELPAAEAEAITRTLLFDYFEAEALRSQWAKILEKEHDLYRSNPPKSNISETPKPGLNKIKIWGTITALAASLALLFYIFSTSQQTALNPIDQLLSAHYEKPFTRNLLKEIPATNDSRMQAYDLYQNHAYSEAIPYFEALLTEYPQDEDLHFFLGLSQLYTHQSAAAINQFNWILAQPTAQRKDAATWFLGLAYTDNEQFEEAKIHLNEVAQWDNNAGKLKMANQAKELIQAITQAGN